MEFHDFTKKHFVQHFGTISRKANVSPKQLNDVHVLLGRFLAETIADYIYLEEIEISHPQGVAIGKQLYENDIIIFSFLRAGLYIASGIREVFNNACMELVSPKRDIGLSDDELLRLTDIIKNKNIIIADSVINTGSTLYPVITQLQECKVKTIHIASLVMPEQTANYIKEKYAKEQNINFYTARVSSNSYVGKGKTDTGNRLFGAFHE